MRWRRPGVWRRSPAAHAPDDASIRGWEETRVFYGKGTSHTCTAGRACRADALAPAYRDTCRTTPRCECRTLLARCRAACAWRGPVRGTLSLRWYPAPG